jgi:hypothetical protein
MKLNYYFAVILSLLFVPAIAQDDSTDTLDNSVSHKMQDGFIGGGFVLGASSSTAAVNYGESREFIVGGGLGYKFVKWNGMGIDIYYRSTGFFLKQDSSKILPNNILHNSEKISFDNFGGLVFDRFYFGSVYLDGGFYYDWAFYTKHIAWDNYTVANNAGGSSTKTIDRQLVFANPANYGLTFRFGNVRGVSLYFNYRLSKVFKSGSLYPDMPPYVLGLVIGTH